MDLRGKLMPAQIDRACVVLNYQPFIIADDIQTGAAYSWKTGNRPDAPLLFRRAEHSPDEWARFTSYAGMQRQMYDQFIEAIAARYPGGSLLDVACNNGYFPVKAELCGMRPTHGVDLGAQHAHAIELLNEALGTTARFTPGYYHPIDPALPTDKFDVVCASTIMCHLPDPLSFLACLGSLAREAVFIFDQVIDTDALLVAYAEPREHLGTIGAFPYRFNRGTRLSRGLLFHGFAEMGFANIVEIPFEHEWLTAGIMAKARPPEDLAPEYHDSWRLGAELLPPGSRHRAILACR